MGIEKEIKQTLKFQSEHHKLVVNILYTASWINQRHTQKLKKFELTPQQFNILRILRGQHPSPATVNLLIDRMIDKSSNASRLVDRLLEKEFVSRCMNENDKRAVNVLITQKGLDTLRQIDEETHLLEEDTATLSKADTVELNRLLDKLRG